MSETVPEYKKLKDYDVFLKVRGPGTVIKDNLLEAPSEPAAREQHCPYQDRQNPYR